MIALVMSFLAGVSCLLWLKKLPSVGILLSVIAFLLLLKHFLSDFFRLFVSFFLIAALGLAWGVVVSSYKIVWYLPKQLEGKNCTIVGVVESIPVCSRIRCNFVFKLESLNARPLRERARLSWYKKDLKLKVGQRWRLVARLKRPWGNQNPGGFDYEKWLFEKDIRVVGYVCNDARNQFLGQSDQYLIQQIRSSLNEKLNQVLKGEIFSGIIKALTVGEKSSITAEQWKIFRNTGTTHLVAISGLHVGLIASFVFFLISFFWRRFSYLVLKFPAPIPAAIGALFASLIYAGLSGFSLPTMRAVIMISVFMLAVIFRRFLSKWRAYSLALLIILFIDPLAVLSSGFWLSFGAVGMILYSMNDSHDSQNFFSKHGRTRFAILFGLMPFTLLFYQQVSLVSLISNAVAIPWVGFVVVPLSLMGVLLLLLWPFAAKWILFLSIKTIALLWAFLFWISQLHFAVWHHGVSNVWLSISAVLGVIIVLSKIFETLRYCGIILFLPLILYHSPKPKPGEVWFTLLDVGQGLSAVVRTENHTLVFDTGPKYSARFNMGKAVVLPFLRQKGINKIDMLVVSHGDNDHIGGAQSILEQMPVKQILTSVPKHFKHHAANFCHQGEYWQWDGVNFEMLSPFKKHLYKKKNDNSCVLKITSGNQSILLTGDIQKEAEKYLVKHEKNKLQTTVLVAPHHGSNSSSSKLFIQAVHPEYVLYPVGHLNRFHFPSWKVKRRYADIGARQLESDLTGALTLRLGGGGIHLDAFRLSHSHYWFSE